MILRYNVTGGNTLGAARRHIRELSRWPALSCGKERGLLGRTEPSLMHGGRTMGKHGEVFVAFDVAKKKRAVAIAEAGRSGEVRFLGDVENSPPSIERTIKRLATRYDRLHVCHENRMVEGNLMHRAYKANTPADVILIHNGAPPAQVGCFEAGPTGYGLYRQVKALRP